MKVRITAIRQTVYPDLMAKYENPIEHTCVQLTFQDSHDKRLYRH